VTYGGDSGNRIFVLYWRGSLIRVSVIRGSTVLKKKACMTAMQQNVPYVPSFEGKL
jgi:hypothetical protein